MRREAGLTLADVATTLGVSKPTVWAWEKGKARPLPERLEAIAAALGVAPDLLTCAPAPREINAVIAECRARIAEACGTDPQAVRVTAGYDFDGSLVSKRDKVFMKGSLSVRRRRILRPTPPW